MNEGEDIVECMVIIIGDFLEMLAPMISCITCQRLWAVGHLGVIEEIIESKEGQERHCDVLLCTGV